MASEKTDAIVTRLVEFSETSLIVTLFSREFGRVSAIAKGARRPKGPFEGALDLLSICHIEVIRKANDALDLLTEAKLARRFRAAQKSLDRLYCGYYVAELLNRWTDDGDPHADLFDTALQTIEQIDAPVAEMGMPGRDHLIATIHFELRAMKILGHSPSTITCASCGTEVSRAAERVPFSHDAGGVLCIACRSRHAGVAMIRSVILDQVDRLTAADSPPPEPLDNDSYRQLRALLNRYITHSLGNRPRTQSMLPTKVAAHYEKR